MTAPNDKEKERLEKKEKLEAYGQYNPLRQEVERFPTLNAALVALDRYNNTNLTPPMGLIEQILHFINPSYQRGLLKTVGGEAYIIYAKNALGEEEAIKIPTLKLPGSEGVRTNTIFDKIKNLWRVEQEDTASKRFLEGTKIQNHVYQLLQQEGISYFGVPKVHNSSIDPLWVVMEWIPGHPVLDWMKESRCGILTAMQIFLKLVKGIAILHENNIIHRDINPNNILLYDKDKVFLVDWTISKRIFDPTRSLTTKNVAMGTGPYAHPAQIKSAAEANIYTDIYSLGFTFVAFVLGKPLPIPVNEKDTYERLQAKYRANRLNDEAFPPIFHNIFIKATDWDESKRYQSANDMANDIEDLIYQLQNTEEGKEIIRMPDTIIPHYRIPPAIQDAQPTPIAIEMESNIPTMVLPPPEPPTMAIDPLEISMMASEVAQQFVKPCSKKSNCKEKNCSECAELYRELFRFVCACVIRLKKGKHI